MTGEYQLCPKCNGSGWAMNYGNPIPTHYDTCDVCHGKKIIERPIIPQPDSNGDDKGKERIKIKKVASAHSTDWDGLEPKVYVYPSRHLTIEEIKKIRPALERVLNDEKTPFEYTFSPKDIEFFEKLTGQKYTQEQMDKAIHDAWYAAREEKEESMPWDDMRVKYQHATLEEYLNSLKIKPA